MIFEIFDRFFHHFAGHYVKTTILTKILILGEKTKFTLFLTNFEKNVKKTMHFVSQLQKATHFSHFFFKKREKKQTNFRSGRNFFIFHQKIQFGF